MHRTKVVQQFYQTRVIDEFVLRGNAAILKCNLPSFIADFVYVEAWIADDGTEILPNSDDFGTYNCRSFIVVYKSILSLNADFHEYHQKINPNATKLTCSSLQRNFRNLFRSQIRRKFI